MSKLLEKRVFLIGGPGGVGKTTLAASLAVELASQGHRTVVLTVDPAKRLAQALGCESFQSDLQKVPLPKGELFASMLDTQHYFDKLIKRFAGSPEQASAILNHPIYRTMVDSLGGTHEYAAMERLLEFATDKQFDKVVVDTPPSQNALDLFSAPERLADFMDNSVFRWFQGNTPGYMKLFRTGTKITLTLFQKIFGSEFMASFSSLLENFSGMQAGFRQRHLDVIKLLKGPETAFLLVTIANEVRFLESKGFIQKLKEAGIPLAGVALNRLEPPCPAPGSEEGAIRDLLHYYHSLYEAQQLWVERFKKEMPEFPFFFIPKLDVPLSDVNSLTQLGRFLLK